MHVCQGVRYEGENDEIHAYYMHLGENDGIRETAAREFGTEAINLNWTVICSYNPNRFVVNIWEGSSSITISPL